METIEVLPIEVLYVTLSFVVAVGRCPTRQSKVPTRPP